MKTRRVACGRKGKWSKQEAETDIETEKERGRGKEKQNFIVDIFVIIFLNCNLRSRRWEGLARKYGSMC